MFTVLHPGRDNACTSRVFVAISLHDKQVLDCEQLRRTHFERLVMLVGLSSPGRALCSACLHLVTLAGSSEQRRPTSFKFLIALTAM